MADEIIAAGLTKFTNEALKIYETHIAAGIKKSYDEFYERIQSQIKENISRQVCGADLYDYSQLPIVEESKQRMEQLNTLTIASAQNQYYLIEPWKKFEEFKKLFMKDKLAICYHCDIRENVTYQPRSISYTIWVTHNAKYIITWGYVNNTGPKEPPCYGDFDFSIPLDYIKILQTLVRAERDPRDNGFTPNPSVWLLVKTLELMKDQLYDRRIVPLYVKDVVAENEQLKAKYAEYEADKTRLAAEMADFAARCEKFENEIRPYTDLEKERAIVAENMTHIRKERERLRLVVQKIMIEKDELEHERRRIRAVDLTQI